MKANIFGFGFDIAKDIADMKSDIETLSKGIADSMKEMETAFK